MNRNYFKVIGEAQKILAESPFDLAHEITHHYRVYENCISIINAEELDVNTELVSITAWWHDILDKNRKVKSSHFFEKTMNNLGYKNEDIEFCLKIIGEHSFGNKQTSLESKILFDADKMEYVNPFRIQLFLDAVDANLISEKAKLKYLKQWQERTPKVAGLLHFEYSKSEYEKMLQKAQSLLKSIIT